MWSRVYISDSIQVRVDYTQVCNADGAAVIRERARGPRTDDDTTTVHETKRANIHMRIDRHPYTLFYLCIRCI